ncbi:MAG: GNAT family N-acetyltransferase [Bdellovibrionaceae bacterium]|nr:GNAT family N-acetyltransferase [Pseudobdellovibrionaceae bacterium]
MNTQRPDQKYEYSIRHLTPNDWQIFREIRLESLKKHPAFFSPSRDETKFSEIDWKERLSNRNSASFGLFSENKIIGLTGIVREGNNPRATKAHLVSSYIREEYRRLGLSKLFFEARMKWAKDQGDIKTLILEHRDDNLSSQKAHSKFGFTLVESNDQTWPDGSFRPSLRYQLNL